jgi:hypothetical protein
MIKRKGLPKELYALIVSVFIFIGMIFSALVISYLIHLLIEFEFLLFIFTLLFLFIGIYYTVLKDISNYED